MKRKSITKAIAFSILAFGLWSCEQDFTEMGSEIIDNDQFGFDKYVVEHVSAVNHESGIANTRNLPTNSLGVYTQFLWKNEATHHYTNIDGYTDRVIFSFKYYGTVLCLCLYFVYKLRGIYRFCR